MNPANLPADTTTAMRTFRSAPTTLPRVQRVRNLAAVLAIALLATTLAIVTGISPAGADTQPIDPQLPATVSSDALPTVQINGVVWDQVVVGNTVYVTGEFTQARPAGAAPGVNQTPRSHLLAFDIRTGNLITTWAPALNAQGLAIDASADGSTIFVGGDFSTVNGQFTNRIAAIDAVTGALLPGWYSLVNTRVAALDVVGDTLYIGGYFSTVDGQPRSRLAALEASTGDLLPWAPSVDREVVAMVVHEPTNRVIVGGSFNTLNGVAQPGMGSIDGATGERMPWAINQVVHNSGESTEIADLATDGTHIFGVGWAFFGNGASANFEGQFSAEPETGEIVWINGCRGDNYGITVLDEVVYTAGHAHDCAMIGGQPQDSPSKWQRSMAFTAATSPYGRTNAYGPYGNWQHFAGRPSSEILHWYPQIDAGSYTGNYQGGYTVEGNSDYLVVGGEFPSVNNVAQQGLVRFPSREIGPNRDAIRGDEDLLPRITAVGSGTVRIGWTAAFDRDNERLRYEVLRGPTTATSVVLTDFFRDQSAWWTRPLMGFVDQTAPPGTSQTYRIRVTDPYGNGYAGPPTTVTVPSGTPPASSYLDAVRADDPIHHWRLGETSGDQARDWAYSEDLTLSSSTDPVAGAIIGDADGATAFPGTSSTSAVQAQPNDWQPGPQVFSVEAWVRTNTNQGGKIIGYGNSRTGRSSSNLTDRHLYMTNNGSFRFGVRPDYGQRITVNSANGFNDNQWHHVVGTLGTTGLRLYVDGQLVNANSSVTSAQVYNGYWRVAGDRLSSWPVQPNREAIDASLDEIAVYHSELTPEQVATHFGIAVGAPTASFTATVTDLSVDFDASASSDNGSVESYDWDFGDGQSAAGALVSHTYSAPGAYTVALTVTDDDGYSTTTSQVVTATAPNVAPTAAFTSTIADLDADFDATTSTDDDGTIETYEWDFGDGETDSTSGANVGHTYAAAGTYTVTLVVTDDDGDSDTTTADITVTDPPNGAPTAAFSTTIADLQVDLDATASTDDDGTVEAYTWDFGDGETDDTSGPVVSHTYAAPGTYTITLTVTDDDGDTDDATDTVTVTVPNVAPTAGFTTTITDTTVDFDASTSSDDDGTIETFAWDFGDGQTDDTSGAIVSHTYSAAGTYTVTLVVTDDDGDSDTATAEITVDVPNVAPTAAFTSGVTGLTVDLDATTSSDSDGTVESYEWDFGDGTTDTTTGAIVSHTYATDGTYTVTLTVTDDDAATDTASDFFTVTTPPPPNEAPTASFTTVITDNQVAFDASASTDDDGTIETFEWDFGDGTTGSGMTIDHTYAAAGTYTIGLTVTDDDGAIGTASSTITVTDPPANVAPTAAFTGTTTDLTVDLDATTSTDSDGTITTYAWDFGDGTTDTTTGAIVNHTYTTAGTYTVTLTVTDDDTATDTATDDFTVTDPANVAPTAAFTGTTTDLTVDLDATTSTDSDGTITTYAWDFGDGTTDTTTGAIVNHTYTTAGTYTVTLTVTDDDTATDTATDDFTVTDPANVAPTAAFTGTTTDLTVDLDATTSTDSDGTITTYAWDFGDGTTDTTTGAIVNHTYTTAGTYTVTLTVTDDDTATDTATDDFTVTDPANVAPTAAFTGTTTDLTVDLDATTSTDSDGTITTYAWDFGDGTTDTTTGAIVNHTYTTAGTYTVTLTVTDDDTATDTATDDFTVTDPANVAPTAAFTGTTTDLTVDLDATTSTDSDGTITTYAWDFGDGTTDTTTGAIVNHTYTTAGTYTVTLTVTDDDTATDTATDDFTVTDPANVAPTAAFTGTTTDLTVDLDATTSTDSDGTITTYAWDFGDGTTDTTTGAIVNHTYTTAGTYTVTLTVTDDDTATDTATDDFTVTDPANVAPTAAFTGTTTDLTVDLDATTSTDSDGTITTYAWDFGDGTTDTTTGAIVNHTYTTAGTYTVTLTVTDDDTATDTATDDFTVTDPANVAPTAAFTGTTTDLTVDLDATTSTDSDGTITTYAWDFGDGTTDTTTGAIVNHTYTTAGTYTVTLTVTDDDTATDTATDDFTVTDPANVAPTAAFTGTTTDLTVDLDATTSTDSDGTITTYAWDFGDGTTDTTTGAIVNHTYTTAGTYTVTLTVTDDDTATDTATDDFTVTDPANVAPTAAFTGTTTDLTVDLDATTSTDSDGTITTYAWDFGDGTTDTTTGAIVNHTYTTAGTYTVTLTVTDDDTATDTATDDFTVTDPANVAPTAAFTGTTTDLTVDLDATTSTDSDGTITTYAWDFGDGTTDTTTGAIVNHTYTTAGTYTVTLTVTDDDTATDTATDDFTVTDPPVVTTYARDAFGRIVSNGLGTADVGGPWTTTGPATSFSVNGAAQILGAPGGTRTGYLTEVAQRDIDISTVVGIDRPATGGGVYLNVLGRRISEGTDYGLKLRYQSNGTVIAYLARRVGGASTTLASTQVPGLTIGAGDAVHVRLQISGTATTVVNAKVWPAGSPEPEAWLLTASEATPAALQAPGQVGFLFYTSGSWTGPAATISIDDLVARAPYVGTQPGTPTAAFVSDVTDLDVDFDATGSSDDGTIESYAWDFGDGATETVASPVISHSYGANGSYVVTLTVTDNDGLTASVSETVTVDDGAGPPPAFLVDQFGRNQVNGLGTADLGGAWSLTGPATSFSVDGAAARVLTASGSARAAYLTATSATDTDALVDVSLDQAATGGGAYVSVIGRRISNGNDYRVKLRYLANGQVIAYLVRTQGGAESVLSSTFVPGVTAMAGDVLRIRLEVTGTSDTTVRTKVWNAATAEPTDWLSSATEATPTVLQAPGHLGLYIYVSGSWTGPTPIVTIDELSARPSA